MSSIDELSSAIGANKEAIEQANASVAGSMSTAEELAGQFQSLGSDDKVGQVEQVKATLEQLQQGLASLSSAAEQAQSQAEALRGLQGGAGGGAPGGGGQESESPAPIGDAGGPPDKPPDKSRSAAGFGDDEEADDRQHGEMIPESQLGEVVGEFAKVPDPPKLLNLEDEDDELDKVMRRTDDLADSVKTTTESLDNIVQGLERVPAQSEMRSEVVQGDDVIVQQVQQTHQTFGKADAAVALSVLGFGIAYTGKKIVNRLTGRHDG